MVTRQLQTEVGEGVRWVRLGIPVPGMGMAAGRQGTGRGGERAESWDGGDLGDFRRGEGEERDKEQGQGKAERRGCCRRGGERYFNPSFRAPVPFTLMPI